MAKKRTTVTINKDLYERAQELMKAEHFDDFSGFVEQMIRDRWRAKLDLEANPTSEKTS